MHRYSFYLLLVVITILASCQVKPEQCLKIIHEKYPNGQVYPVLFQQAIEEKDSLLEDFNETPIKNLDHTAYHLLFYSSHGYGRSIKVEQKDSTYLLSQKNIPREGWFPERENYQIRISEEEWAEFEAMIYEFDFWTAQHMKINQDVLDGFVYFLEGNRPSAKKCKKRTYQLLVRGSPEYDKIGALCDYILRYEEELSLKYGKRRSNR